MKNIINKHSFYPAVVAILMSACTSETPFSSAEREGTLRLNVSVNHKITRAEISGEEEQKLLDDCVIYISDENGLLHKWQGYNNLPSEITLKYGTYLAEAWSGDSVTASLTSKFYKGQQSFTLNDKNQIAQVSVNCRIANVIGSIDETTILNSMRELKVTFGNSRGSVDMANDDLYGKAYLMMPDEDNTLLYTVSCLGEDGKKVEVSGSVEDVKQGHEYRLQFKSDENKNTAGGAFFEIKVVEFNDEVDHEFVIFGKPDFSWDDETLQIDGQIKGEKGNFTSKILRVGAYGGFKSLYLETGDMKPYLGGINYEIIGHENLSSLNGYGIYVEELNEPREDGLYVWYITFSDKFLNSLPERNTEYVMTVKVVDNSDKSNSTLIRVANTKAAVVEQDPVVVDTAELASDLMAIGATSATIPYSLSDNSIDYGYIGIEYREENQDTWMTKDIKGTRAGTNGSIVLTGLKDNSVYYYRLVGRQPLKEDLSDFTSREFSFKTETKFEIPNSSMEDWYKDGKVMEPSLQSTLHKFWDSGNHGSSTLNVTLTQSSTEIVGSGTYSAKLRSQFVGITGNIGKFAAGNIFAGVYKDTDGTNGIIDFGQPFNGSHPKALKLLANYRPGKVEKKVSGQDYLSVGDTDYGQIYIALTTSPVTVNTGNKSTLFSKDFDSVIAYGEVTWHENFGEDNQMKEIIIDFEYKPAAKTQEPKYIVIVCSASKFGDYFVGGEGSTMYVDDFELVY
ncbi:MAG: PCMD domain-containing protein [Muribaculaceae bacterium]|nr:PCMD domain-containing protein [Muribaculaceae bacterium]